MTDQPLSGKVALVTGAGRGIGREIALRLARDGADIVAHYAASKAGAEQTVAEIAAMGRKAVAYRADIAQRSEVVAMFAGIAQSVVSFVRPDGVRFQAAAQVGFEVVSLTMIGILLAAAQWVTLAAPAGATPAEAQKLVEIVAYMNQFFLIGLLISGAISLYQLAHNVRRYRRLSR